jgi:hypothetical protein
MKMDIAFKSLPKNRWVSSSVIKLKTGEKDLRSVRRLRELGYEIETRVNKGVYQYRRLND